MAWKQFHLVRKNKIKQERLICHAMQYLGKPTIGVDHKTFAKTLWPMEKLQVVYAYNKSLFMCQDNNEHKHSLMPLTDEPSPKYYTALKCWYFRQVSEWTNQSFGFRLRFFVLAHEQPFSKTELLLETKFIFSWCQAGKDDPHQTRQINQFITGPSPKQIGKAVPMSTW